MNDPPLVRTPSLSFRNAAGLTALAAGFVIAASAAREITVARAFGADPDLDRYLVVTTFPLAVVSLFTSGWIAAAAPQLRYAQPSTEASRSYWACYAFVAVPFLLLALTIAYVATALILESRVGTPDNWLSEFLVVSLSMAIAVTAGGWYPHELIAGRPAVPVILPVFVHLSILLSVVLVGPDANALFAGLLSGNLLILVVLLLWRRLRAPSVQFPSHRVRGIYRSLAPILAGGMAMALAQPIDVFFAADQRAGGPALLNFATRVPMAVMLVGSTVIANAGFSKLLATVHDPTALQRLVRRWCRQAFAYGTAAAILIVVLSSVIASVLFESPALAGADLETIVQLQAVSALATPAFLVAIVLVRALNTLVHNGPILVISAVNLAVNILGNWGLGDRFGLHGIALATVVMYCASGLMLYRAWMSTTRVS